MWTEKKWMGIYISILFFIQILVSQQFVHTFSKERKEETKILKPEYDRI